MKIILLKDTANLGKRGDVKDVPEVYAINVLIKKGNALQATPAELLKWKQKNESEKHKKEIQTNTFLQLIDKLHKEKVTITGKKHDDKGQLFAQIKDVDIADAIFALTSFSIDPKQVTISSPIKSIGAHIVELKQGAQKEKITIEVK
ncbi:MAG: 50S ribosomal protein L9 [Candidatus Paceibacterota bacterium]